MYLVLLAICELITWLLSAAGQESHFKFSSGFLKISFSFFLFLFFLSLDGLSGSQPNSQFSGVNANGFLASKKKVYESA